MNLTDKFITAIAITICILITAGCGETDMNKTLLLQTDSISEKDWDALSRKKIYFGHMSVGFNIIDGINNLMKDNPKIRLDLRESTDMSAINTGTFMHSRNGKNGNPGSKIDAFISTIENGVGQKTDIAFFKFCYVDFNQNTDVKSLFNYYTSAMNRLRKKYPDLRILHATVPLTTEGETLKITDKLKDIIKSIMGRQGNSRLNMLSNIKRNEFNSLLMKEYGKDAIIDIAGYESTGPDGKKYIKNNAGTEYQSMVPEYTYDGGHLNETGKKAVADKFLTQLVKIQ